MRGQGDKGQEERGGRRYVRMVSEAKRTSLRADKGCSYRCSVGACTRRCVEHEKLPRAESATNAEYTYNMFVVTPLLILFAASASSAGGGGCF